MDKVILKSLAPKGRLRAGINLSNFLLVPEVLNDGTPTGTSPDVAMRVATELGVECEFITFDGPGLLADASAEDKWDIGNIANEAARASVMDFTRPYALIDAHFLVQKNSRLRNNQDVDTTEVTVATPERTAYDLWLTENLRNVSISRAGSMSGARELFTSGRATVLAGLKPALMEEVVKNPQYEILQPMFTAIKQAIGIKKGNPQALAFLNQMVAEMVSSGFIYESLLRHNVQDKLTVAPQDIPVGAPIK